MNQLKRLPALLAGLLAASAVSAIGVTASAANAPEVAVKYGDLDLGRPADLAQLYARLQTAADTVCVSARPYELARFAAHQRCVQAVLEHSVLQVRSEALLALHRASAANHHHGTAGS
jgi:UrcA family protein